LKIVMVNAHPQVTLMGKPATATDKDSTLSAGVIHLSGNDQISQVDGPGQMVTQVGGAGLGVPGAPAPAPDAQPLPARPMKLTWSQGATLNGKTNLIDVLGDVNAQSVSADGTIDVAHSKELIATLAAAPTTRPVVGGGQDDFNFMQNKQLQSVSLRSKASVKSTLSDAAGKVVRQYYIRSNQIDYDTVGRKMSVPMPGQMLVEDLRPPSAAAIPGQTPVGGRGYTAFQWSEELLYDELARSADLQGNVRIRHWDAGNKPKAMFLRADTVHAEFQPIDQSDDAAQTADTPALEISHLTAEHHVEVDTSSGPLRCGVADYDPVKQLLICRAGDEGAVTIVDGAGNVQASFKEVRLDLQNNTMEQR
jgi:hypothetical protein